MRTNVSFRHPAEFIGIEPGQDILDITGADWFVDLLDRVPSLEMQPDLGQEDWGVVVLVRRNAKQFWVGLSAWYEEGYWLAHFHHGSYAWLQRFSSSGNKELNSLVNEFHGVLRDDSKVSHIVWYEEREMREAYPTAHETPGEV